MPPALSSRSNRSGGSRLSSRRPASPRGSEVAGDRADGSASSSGNLTFVPGAPRDNDDCVDIWRHILGVETSALPRGIEITGGDGPFIPDARAEYIRRVLSGFTAEQQALMTLGLMTVLRAMLAELGVILHASSFVDVVAEGPEDPGDDGEDEDGEGVTLMLQMDVSLDETEALALVQQDVAVVSGVMSRLQDALMGDDRGLSRVRAAHLRARVHKLRLGNFVDRDVADRVEALCVVVEEHGHECLAGGFHAMEAQVAEWTWGWWRVLEPLMVQQLDNPPVESGSIQIASSLSTIGGLSGSLGSADLAELDADQAEARRDAAALQHQQELFEEEESRYYQGVEAAVQAELSRAEAQACRDWDDWALWDSMYNSPVRGRKRTFLNVSVSSGATSSAQVWSVPVDGLAGQQITLSFRTVVEAVEGHDNTCGSGSPDSGATTVPAAVDSLRVLPPPGGVPLEFPQFQAVYESWSQGHLSAEAVQAQYGPETLELIEAQKIVISAEAETGPARDEMAAGVVMPNGGVTTLSRNSTSAGLGPGLTIPRDVGAMTSRASAASEQGSHSAADQGGGLEDPGVITTCTDTLLDELLTTCTTMTETDE